MGVIYANHWLTIHRLAHLQSELWIFFPSYTESVTNKYRLAEDQIYEQH